MKKRKFTVTQIIGMLREAEALLSTSKTVSVVCRHLSIAESSYYQWRAQYTGVEPDQRMLRRAPRFLSGPSGPLVPPG